MGIDLTHSPVNFGEISIYLTAVGQESTLSMAALSMADLPDDSWREFLCVENGQTNQIALAQGDSWSASVTFEADLATLDARL